ncbi:winged helix-turn-helix domain-containing protein [Streptomyces sp. NPDC058308]|uniref:winged helix-turn-helix domain-containing protein n=1 Tax=Streptomyces sp. NPDC058308 TaxID=3346440 RepID=UPI0036EF6E89
MEGTYPPGSQLPPAREIQERFKVVNSTVQNAYRRLKQDGLVYAVKGRGVFGGRYRSRASTTGRSRTACCAMRSPARRVLPPPSSPTSATRSCWRGKRSWTGDGTWCGRSISGFMASAGRSSGRRADAACSCHPLPPLDHLRTAHRRHERRRGRHGPGRRPHRRPQVGRGRHVTQGVGTHRKAQ